MRNLTAFKGLRFSRLGSLLASTSLAFLFANQEPGIWLDPSDLTTLFQDPAGTIPVTAPGQSVGLMFDKSKGLALGPERLTNGDFASGATGWSVSGEDATHILTFADGKVRFQSDTTTPILDLRQSVLVVGKTYEVTVVVSDWVSGSIKTDCRGTTDILATGIGTFKLRLLAANPSFNITRGSTNVDMTIESVSVRELLGHHAIQTIPAARPTYGVVPLGGRRNQLRYTEQFANSAWDKVRGSVVSGVSISPSGASADKFVIDTTPTNTHFMQQSYSFVSGVTYLWRALVKSDGISAINLRFSGSAFPAGNATFNLLLGTNSKSGVGIANIEPLGGGWYLCEWSATAEASGAGFVQMFLSTGSITIPTGDGVSGVLVSEAQLDLGQRTPYQRVGSAFDVTEAGVPSLSYLSFDGVDDFLVTPTITPGIDKVQVFAGVRKLSDASEGYIFTHGNPASLEAGSLALNHSGGSGTEEFAFGVRSSVTRYVLDLNATHNAPFSGVIVARADNGVQTVNLNVNGLAYSTSGQGAGAFRPYPQYIGRRNGTAYPFNGNIYGLIVRFGPNLNESQIKQAESLLAQKIGVTI